MNLAQSRSDAWTVPAGPRPGVLSPFEATRCPDASLWPYGSFTSLALPGAPNPAVVIPSGDPDGVAARVLRNLLDLLPITKSAIALPLPSYSLKVVEEYVGFKRTQDEYGGSWAMAQFILATETEDEAERNARMAEILKYNEEDLAATWVVFEWLWSKRTGTA